MTFSMALISGKSRMFWKVREMPNRLIWCGLSPLTWSPAKRTSPVVGRNTPVITLKAVVLPAPLGPIRPRISPSLT